LGCWVIEPSHVWVPPRDGSLLGAVSYVSGKVGRVLYPAQELAVDVLTSSWADRRPATLERAIICPRQNLKTFVLECIVLTWMTMPDGPRLVVWSAHEVATAQETFQAFLDLADTFKWLGDRIVHVSRATGREAITFRGNRRLKFRARVTAGGRGLAGDGIVLDEAFALKPAHLGSLIPILSTRPMGQVIYGSSAPLASSDVLWRIVERGRSGADGGITYVEWSSPGSWDDPGCASGASCSHDPGTDGCVMDDMGVVVAGNPAAAADVGRIGEGFLCSERLALPPSEYGRERLGWGESATSESTDKLVEFWLAQQDSASNVADECDGVVFAVDVAPERRSASIAVCGVRESGGRHLGLVDNGPGTSWVVGRLMDLVSRHKPVAVVLDDSTPNAALIRDLVDVYSPRRSARNPTDPLIITDSRQMADACAGLIEELESPSASVWHRGEPLVLAAMQAAGRRRIGDAGWGWARRGAAAPGRGVDISPLVAMTLALWGHGSCHAGGDAPLVAWR
jgi:hypothetical protein